VCVSQPPDFEAVMISIAILFAAVGVAAEAGAAAEYCAIA
jgi:hypothetical protein